MTAAEIADAEEAVRELVDADVARLLRPALRHEHAPIVEQIDRLPWGAEPTDFMTGKALTILKVATMPGGLADPKEDDADIAWAIAINRTVRVPSVGSRMGRAWFVHGMRLLGADAEVSAVFMSVAAYATAWCEAARGNRNEVARWITIAGIESEVDDRPGVGLAVVVRAARLLPWQAP
jgi:hypothetical protein